MLEKCESHGIDLQKQLGKTKLQTYQSQYSLTEKKMLVIKSGAKRTTHKINDNDKKPATVRVMRMITFSMPEN